MRFRAVTLMFVALAACATAQRQEPRSIDMTKCDTKLMHPPQFEGMGPGQGIRSVDYYRIQTYRDACDSELAEVAIYNKKAAEQNQPDSGMDNLKDYGVGAGITLFLEAVLAILLIH